MLIFRGVYSIVQIGFSHPPPAMLSTFVVVADPMTAVRLGAIEVTIDGTCSGRKSRVLSVSRLVWPEINTC